MTTKQLLVLLSLSVVGCRSVPWQERVYAGREDVARVLFDGVERQVEGKLDLVELASSLQNTRVVFTKDDGTEVTVRDLCFEMLYDAGIVGLPDGRASCKLICGCMIRGEWYRFHVTKLTEEDFQAVVREAQQKLRGR